MNKKYFFIFLAVFILICFLINFVSAIGISGEKFVFEKRMLELDFWKDLFLNFPKILFLQNEPFEHNWFERFFVGIFAGLMMWSVFKFRVMWYNRSMRKPTIFGEGEDPLFKRGISWMGLIASRLWKVFILGVFFALVTLIPVVGFVIYILTFDWLSIPMFFKSIILAFEIGYFPSIYQYYHARKFHKKLIKQRKKEILQRAMLENEMRKQRRG